MVRIFTVILASLISISTFAQQIGDTQTGQLQYYNDIYHGRPTASGEIYDKTKVSAAHKSLPMKTMVEVVNLENNKSIFVEINDRTPEGSEAILELSRAAAEQLDFIHDGVTKGQIRIIQVLQPSITTQTTRIKQVKAPKPEFEKVKSKVASVVDADHISTKVIDKTKEVTDFSEKQKEVESSNEEISEEMSIEDAIKIGDKKYAIQLGAYKEKASLNAALRIAKDKGIYLKKNLFIITDQTDNGDLYKLIYGYFGEDLAKVKLKEMKKDFKDSFLKKF